MKKTTFDTFFTINTFFKHTSLYSEFLVDRWFGIGLLWCWIVGNVVTFFGQLKRCCKGMEEEEEDSSGSSSSSSKAERTRNVTQDRLALKTLSTLLMAETEKRKKNQ